MMALSIGFVYLAYFHLLSHALFKSLLFICAGAIIHSSGETQDLRFMGNLVMFIPVIRICINLANLALCGIPFISGFYSKDIMVEASLDRYLNLLIFILLLISVGLTAIYSFRLSFYRM